MPGKSADSRNAWKFPVFIASGSCKSAARLIFVGYAGDAGNSIDGTVLVMSLVLERSSDWRFSARALSDGKLLICSVNRNRKSQHWEPILFHLNALSPGGKVMVMKLKRLSLQQENESKLNQSKLFASICSESSISCSENVIMANTEQLAL